MAPIPEQMLSTLTTTLLAVYSYWSCLSSDFTYDDRAAVLGNPDVASPAAPLLGIFTHDFWGANITLSSSHKSFRPLTVLSFRLDRVIGGLNPVLFHGHAALLHVLCSLLVVQLIILVVGVSPSRAWLAGALFAVHPVHVEPVCSIVGRADLLCTAFFMLAILALARGSWSAKSGSGTRSLTVLGDALWLGVSSLLAVAASFTKETGFAVFPGLILFDILLANGGSHTEAGSPTLANAAVARRGAAPLKPAHTRIATISRPVRLSVLVVSAALALQLRRIAVGDGPGREWTAIENQLVDLPLEPYHTSSSGGGGVTLSLTSMYAFARSPRALTTMHTHAAALWLLLWPEQLVYHHASPPLYFPSDPRVLSIITAYGAAIALSVLLLVQSMHSQRARAGLFVFTALCLAPYVPASNVLFLVGTALAERLLYLPSVGFITLLALLLPRFAWEPEDAVFAEEAIASGTVAMRERREAAAQRGDTVTATERPKSWLRLARRQYQQQSKGDTRASAIRSPASASSAAESASLISPPPRTPQTTTRSRERLRSHYHPLRRFFSVSLLTASQLAGVGACLLLCVWWTRQRTADWRDEGALFLRGFTVAPNNVNVLNNLAGHIMAGGALPPLSASHSGGIAAVNATLLLRRAIAILPSMSPALTNLGQIAWQAGDVPGAFDWAWRAEAAQAQSRIVAPCRNNFLIGAAYLFAVEQHGSVHSAIGVETSTGRGPWQEGEAGGASTADTSVSSSGSAPTLQQLNSDEYPLRVVDTSTRSGSAGSTPTLPSWLLSAGGASAPQARFLLSYCALEHNNNTGTGCSASALHTAGVPLLELADAFLHRAALSGCATPDVLHTLGVVQKMRGDPEAALSSFTAAIAAQGFTVNTVYARVPRTEAAAATAGGTTAPLSPEQPQSQQQQREQQELAHYTDAVVTLTRAHGTGGSGLLGDVTTSTGGMGAHLQPFDSHQLGSSANMLTLTYEELADTLKTKNAAAAAAALTSAAPTSAPTDAAASEQPHLDHHQLSLDERLQRLLALSKAYSRIALAARPDDATFATNAGALHTRLGDAAAALQHSRRAVELAPSSGVVWSNLGYACERFGDDDCASEAYDRALELLPEHAQVRRNHDNWFATPRGSRAAAAAATLAATIAAAGP